MEAKVSGDLDDRGRTMDDSPAYVDFQAVDVTVVEIPCTIVNTRIRKRVQPTTKGFHTTIEKGAT